MRKSHKRSAFTLVELMIIVAILSDVLIVAMPAFLRARNLAQNTKFITDLRTGTAGFEMYAAENNRYPNQAAPGAIPSGMNPYLNGMAWSSTTPIGGLWDWEPGAGSPLLPVAQLGVSFVAGTPGNPDDVRMTDIDTRMDNGALSTGGFRKQSDSTYMHIIE